MRIIAEIEVDEDIIKKVSGQESLDNAIKMEFEWLDLSGMSLKSWKCKEEKHNEK